MWDFSLRLQPKTFLLIPVYVDVYMWCSCWSWRTALFTDGLQTETFYCEAVLAPSMSKLFLHIVTTETNTAPLQSHFTSDCKKTSLPLKCFFSCWMFDIYSVNWCKVSKESVIRGLFEAGTLLCHSQKYESVWVICDIVNDAGRSSVPASYIQTHANCLTALRKFMTSIVFNRNRMKSLQPS